MIKHILFTLVVEMLLLLHKFICYGMFAGFIMGIAFGIGTESAITCGTFIALAAITYVERTLMPHVHRVLGEMGKEACR